MNAHFSHSSDATRQTLHSLTLLNGDRVNDFARPTERTNERPIRDAGEIVLAPALSLLPRRRRASTKRAADVTNLWTDETNTRRVLVVFEVTRARARRNVSDRHHGTDA